VDQYLDYAMAARVIGIGDPWIPQTRPLTFWDWSEHGVEGRFPDLEDWRSHLSTLMPEVRPREGIELHSVDSQVRAFWSVPLTLCSALLCDDAALSRVVEGLEPFAGASTERWEAASRTGLLDPELGEQASWLFSLAADSLLRLRSGWVSTEMTAAFVTFGRRFAGRRLTPADQILDLFLDRGGLSREDWLGIERRWNRVVGVPASESAGVRRGS
jgi:glutamate--cysteine ligase